MTLVQDLFDLMVSLCITDSLAPGHLAHPYMDGPHSSSQLLFLDFNRIGCIAFYVRVCVNHTREHNLVELFAMLWNDYVCSVIGLLGLKFV